MIPLLSLGIPGDPATAILLSGLLIHGLIPGPMLFLEHSPEIYEVYLAIVGGYVFVAAAALLGAIAYGLNRAKIPLTPIILGLVLGPSNEREFRTAMILSEGKFDIFYSSLPAVGFLLVALLIVSIQVFTSVRVFFAKPAPKAKPGSAA